MQPLQICWPNSKFKSKGGGKGLIEKNLWAVYTLLKAVFCIGALCYRFFPDMTTRDQDTDYFAVTRLSPPPNTKPVYTPF